MAVTPDDSQSSIVKVLPGVCAGKGLDCVLCIYNDSYAPLSVDEGDVMAALWRPSRVEVFNAANYTGLAKHLDPESRDAGLALLQTCGGGEFQEEGGCDCDAAVESGDSIISRLDLAPCSCTLLSLPISQTAARTRVQAHAM